MPKAKKVVVKKRKNKQQVSVNVTVNSNNRRKTLSRPHAQSPIYIPSSSQTTPTVVLKHDPMPYPNNNSDIASHLETVVKKLAAHQTLANTTKEPVKQLIHTATETTPVPVEIKKEEPVLTPIPMKQERLLESRVVPEGIHKVDTFMTPIRYPKGVAFDIPKMASAPTRFERLLGEVRTPTDESRLLEKERRNTPSPEPDTKLRASDPGTPYFPNNAEMKKFIQGFPDVTGIQNFNEKQLKDCIRVQHKYGQEAMLVRIEQIKKERKAK